jgi:hypothetical protein
MNRIIWQPWGGLGDNLQYSTLPERFMAAGDACFISSANVYRNHEIFDLVWRSNPYVKGVSEDTPNAGACLPFSRAFGSKSIVYNQEHLHRLTPLNETPKIYYQPQPCPAVEGSVLVDFSGHTRQWVIPADLDAYLQEHFPGREIVVPVSPNHANQYYGFKHDRKAPMKDIFEFCDAIAACHCFVCSCSGNNALASALNKEKTTCFIFDRNDQYAFPNITYVVPATTVPRN